MYSSKIALCNTLIQISPAKQYLNGGLLRMWQEVERVTTQWQLT